AREVEGVAQRGHQVATLDDTLPSRRQASEARREADHERDVDHLLVERRGVKHPAMVRPGHIVNRSPGTSFTPRRCPGCKRVRRNSGWHLTNTRMQPPRGPFVPSTIAAWRAADAPSC